MCHCYAAAVLFKEALTIRYEDVLVSKHKGFPALSFYNI